ncbi:MAG TPA: Fic family protein [Planctomycetota bacterium]|nr:Fic family protein [Planctomycetota bacterium]
MARTTGTYDVSGSHEEPVRAFVPLGLPPVRPALVLAGELERLHLDAVAALRRLAVAGSMVPSAQWFLYGFVRKEALVSSQIEGSQATFEDVVFFEATRRSDRPGDVEEVCNYVDALTYARSQLANPQGLPLCSRLLADAHARLMRGVRGAEKQPGKIRTSQNWIGGSRPGTARLVPPPPERVQDLLSDLDRWLHAPDSLPPLVRTGLAHVQFETIHPFLDGNGRIGRLLITLLVEHWGLMNQPLLYLSLAFKRHRSEYYERLSAVRTGGDWEGWTHFFLTCVIEAAEDGIQAATRIFRLLNDDRRRVLAHDVTTVAVLRLLEVLPDHPMLTLALATKQLKTNKVTAMRAIQALEKAKVLYEITGKSRDRVYAYRKYLAVLSEDTEMLESP